MNAPRVLLLCGGQSDEHEVSLASARSVMAAVESTYAITPLVIDEAGKLLPGEASRRALAAGRAAAGEGDRALLRFTEDANGSAPFDLVFPLLHGPKGEDGTVQGMLDLVGVPYVGSGVLASAVGMDKLMMKSVFAAHGLPQVRYRGVLRSAWRADRRAVLEAIDLPFPLFVKPANLGSSVGITKVSSGAALPDALDLAFRHDRRVIVEEGVVGARELEVGVLGNDQPEASPVGEIVYSSEFYDYGTKYTEGRARLEIPAAIPAAVAERCRQLALQAFGAIDAAGLARVDFFYLEESGELLLNEINTMPGFTVTSMYPKLWEAAGLGYPQLVRRLIDLALEER